MADPASLTLYDPRVGYDRTMRDTLAEAYTRTRGPVAYLDESYQAPDPVITTANTFYIFTAVVVHHEDMDELRKGLEDIAGGRYWHTRDALAATKGRQQTEDMLGFLADGSEACVIAHRVPVDATDHDAEQARRACYRGMAMELARGAEGKWDPVELLVLEQRNQKNFRNKDRKNHSELVAEAKIPRHTRQIQVSPSLERLLWLPDVVSMAFRRTLTHHDRTSTLFEIVKDQVHFVQPVD